MESDTSRSPGYAALRREGVGTEFFRQACGDPWHLHPGLKERIRDEARAIGIISDGEFCPRCRASSTGVARLSRTGSPGLSRPAALGQVTRAVAPLTGPRGGVTFLSFDRFSYHLIGDRHHRIEYTRTNSMRMNGSGEKHLRPWPAACLAPLTGIAGGELHSCARFLFLPLLHGCTALVLPAQEGAA